MAGKPKDITGAIFGDLKVLSYDHPSPDGSYWLCECLRCGTRVVVPAHSLRKGNTKSCGCGERANRSLIDARKEPYLREGTNVAQIRSGKARSNNTSGVRGVSWCAGRQRWIAAATLAGKTHRSSHMTLEEAVEGRKLLEEKWFKPVIEAHEAERNMGDD